AAALLDARRKLVRACGGKGDGGNMLDGVRIRREHLPTNLRRRYTPRARRVVERRALSMFDRSPSAWCSVFDFSGVQGAHVPALLAVGLPANFAPRLHAPHPELAHRLELLAPLAEAPHPVEV